MRSVAFNFFFFFWHGSWRQKSLFHAESYMAGHHTNLLKEGFFHWHRAGARTLSPWPLCHVLVASPPTTVLRHHPPMLGLGRLRVDSGGSVWPPGHTTFALAIPPTGCSHSWSGAQNGRRLRYMGEALAGMPVHSGPSQFSRPICQGPRDTGTLLPSGPEHYFVDDAVWVPEGNSHTLLS